MIAVLATMIGGCTDQPEPPATDATEQSVPARLLPALPFAAKHSSVPPLTGKQQRTPTA